MALKGLESFALVGGTALSLRYGHRTSIDLDLFSNQEFDRIELNQVLSEKFGEVYAYEFIPKSPGIFCLINGVKVDLVKYPFQLLAPIEEFNGIRMYGDTDIGAMKIQAIIGRGMKKDFWDIAELLRHYNVGDLIQWYLQKFPDQLIGISVPNALLYFNDADESEEPVSLRGETWEDIKGFIEEKVRDYLG